MGHAVGYPSDEPEGVSMSNAQDRTRAVAELAEELAEFSYDGLTLLRAHLGEGRVLRGSWAGCVISYKRGDPGSARRDRRGRARNAFTRLWDAGWMTDEEVLRRVDAELAHRRSKLPRPDDVVANRPHGA
jgi:hypothetical protein